ncbi:hypothetical protein, partial [Heyndrickxia sporothermodurans]
VYMRFISVFFIGFILLFNIQGNQVNAKTNDPIRSFKITLKNDGYVSLNKAISTYENKEKVNVLIPDIPINYNYKVGKAYKNELKLIWYDLNSITSNNFILNIKPAKKKEVTFLPLDKSEKVILKNGIEGYFFKDNFYMFAFIKDQVEYCYTLKKSTLTKEGFIEIANTFN